MKLTIGYLYPKLMNTYGDQGNIITLVDRCQRRNLDVEVKEIEINESIPEDIDLFFWGGGQDKAQILASEDLKVKGKQLIKSASEGKLFLGICGGYQLLGHYYKPFDGEELKGLGILDVTTVAGNKRMIGNIVIELNSELQISHSELRTLVGFENHSGKTYLGKEAKPLGRILVGGGNNGEDRFEGAYQNKVFGTYLHGPLLPKNPHFADFLIKKALEVKHSSVDLKTLDDSLEFKAHQTAIERARQIR
ncbi:MAG: glutamine amidotransferase [Candidatus Woykebacteria bacterium RBG_13_40_7b]|uniref:Lipid II isoglutaminyl synthase (glutamine-hydrolyzing) subunit GatD n=1 Tax=Candidatus Woykebacteria bacterium RBG_13_40_7b TaxID=1802594 RepID=A0A1G1W896_9BACT|nr:MAG: glutamine amidotransferase [Candidatus Woykebacteria bacterium RBG_13_40_7b]